MGYVCLCVCLCSVGVLCFILKLRWFDLYWIYCTHKLIELAFNFFSVKWIAAEDSYFVLDGVQFCPQKERNCLDWR